MTLKRILFNHYILDLGTTLNDTWGLLLGLPSGIAPGVLKNFLGYQGLNMCWPHAANALPLYYYSDPERILYVLKMPYFYALNFNTKLHSRIRNDQIYSINI